jgi:hypothetical protein
VSVFGILIDLLRLIQGFKIRGLSSLSRTPARLAYLVATSAAARIRPPVVVSLRNESGPEMELDLVFLFLEQVL